MALEDDNVPPGFTKVDGKLRLVTDGEQPQKKRKTEDAEKEGEKDEQETIPETKVAASKNKKKCKKDKSAKKQKKGKKTKKSKKTKGKKEVPAKKKHKKKSSTSISSSSCDPSSLFADFDED